MLLFLICALPALSASAQTPVQGVVVDETGEPLIGVSVVEKGTNNAVATDLSGEFTLRVPDGATLVFSYVGYTPAERKATSRMRVVMSSKSMELDDVVVVAYGTQKKVTVTGAVNSVGNAEIKKSSAPNISAALAGKLPGLTTIQTNGEPGRDDVTMYLRGVATTNDASPLILVDGVPRESIREIDANEVETITVLKDASATAVFGVRGANGVILITSRRGEKGKVTVHPSVQYSMQTFSRTRQRVNSWEYARLINEARANEGIAAAYTDEEIAKFDMWQNGGPTDASDRYWYPNTDWQSILFKDFASMVRANVDVSGGSDRLQYFVNVGYLYQGGMYNAESKSKLGYDPQSTLNRYNLRSNLDYTFSKYVKASLDLSSYIEKVNGTNGYKNVIYADGLTASPTAPGPTTTSDYMTQVESELRETRAGQVLHDATQGTQSAYGNLNRRGYVLETRSGLNAIANLDIDLSFITPGLSAKGLVSFESRNISTTTANKEFVSYNYTRDTTDEMPEPHYTFSGDDDEDTPISLSRSVDNGWYVNLQGQINYQRTFKEKHYVTAMALGQRDIREVRWGSGWSYPYLWFNVIGFSGRATYAYDSRYLAEVNVGYNGSEQFAPENRFGFFPAFSAGWVVSNEQFLRENEILTHLKLRASYGKVGNDKLGSERFLYMDDISQTSSSYWATGITSLANGTKITENKLGNENLKWETAWKQNYGIDLTLFRDLSISFDYFLENRENVLIERSMVPLISGLSSSVLPKVNMGKVDNKGYEISLSYRKTIDRDLSFSLGGNFSFNKNTVIYIDEPQYSEEYAYRYRETGYSIGQLWGYLIDYSYDPETGRDGTGYFYSKESIEKSGLTYNIGTPYPGDFIYQDLNGDGVIDDKDQAPIGYSDVLPRITYGFNFGVNWRGIDFSVMFQGTGQYSRYYSGWGIDEGIGSHSYTDIHLGRWSEERYAAGETITYPRLANSSNSVSHLANNFFIMDASYLRLKNIELGYTFPDRLTKKFGATGVRVYVTGDNLYTWDHLRTNSIDPEQTEMLTYPLLRSFNFGISANF